MALIPGNALTKFQVPRTDLGGLTLSIACLCGVFFFRVSITEPFFINFYKENTNMLDYFGQTLPSFEYFSSVSDNRH